MKMNKTLLISAIAVIGAFATLATVGVASATTDNTHDSLISKIASKFNLQESDVKAVFEQDRTEHQAERQKEYESKLTQAVKDGKLTTEQKDKLLAKHNELQTERESNRETARDITQEERHTSMETRRTEIEKWGKDNNIPIEYLHLGEGRDGHQGRM